MQRRIRNRYLRMVRSFCSSAQGIQMTDQSSSLVLLTPMRVLVVIQETINSYGWVGYWLKQRLVIQRTNDHPETNQPSSHPGIPPGRITVNTRYSYPVKLFPLVSGKPSRSHRLLRPPFW